MRAPFHDDIFDASMRCRLTPVSPQPSGDFVAFVDTPHWLTDTLLSPVLIEVHPEPIARFVEVFAGRVTLDDLRHAVGDLWMPGANFCSPG